MKTSAYQKRQAASAKRAAKSRTRRIKKAAAINAARNHRIKERNRHRCEDHDRPMISANGLRYDMAERNSATCYGGIGLAQAMARQSGLADSEYFDCSTETTGNPRSGDWSTCCGFSFRPKRSCTATNSSVPRTPDSDVLSLPAVTPNLKPLAYAANQLSRTPPRVTLDGRPPPRRIQTQIPLRKSLVPGLGRFTRL